ncbi:DUF6531 domain-containing protein [Streptomyces profundus]|uniref:DUF6531 domain-containing protein n=1 Tax=Streptomyces profundus TaxID=2867410 RepID=UPI001D165E75|nr:DUF6531 domain-containing protein [Streptomyces sp. MA3_2.13]UED84711.1 DUF6531 domain-containing protein [Streptomyces sp. MA3_2.13]
MERDPTPGDPEEVRELADELQVFADDVGEALGRIRGLASERAVLDWAGLSADAFRGEFDGVPGNLTKLEQSYSLCAGALRAYWPKLQAAQGMADRALDRAISAQVDLGSAQSALGDATDWVGRAGEEAERLQRAGEWENVEPPDEAEVRDAARDRQAADAAATAAQGRVDDAEERLSAARQLAQDAQEMREEAARQCAQGIDEASDAGIQNRRWWEKAINWVTENWDTFVEACKVIVAVLGLVVMIIGGPLAWVVLAAALVVLADTLVKFAQGKVGLLDVVFAALDCIPGMKGITTAAGLARGLRSAGRVGLRGMSQGLRGAARSGRRMVTEGARGAYNRTRDIVRNVATDPVDMATGAMYLPQTDLVLPGTLPLAFRRRVESGYHAGRWFGPSWASTVDQRLEIDDEGVVFVTEDGLLLVYPMPPEPDVPVYPDEGSSLALRRQSDGGWTVSDSLTGHVRRFASQERGIAPLMSLSDRNGATTSFLHDEDGTPTRIRHSAGYELRLTTDEGRVTALKLVDPDDGSLTTIRRYEYEAGNLVAVVGPSDASFRLSYDERLRVTSWTDSNGRSYFYRYDERDRCVAQRGEEDHLSLAFAYDIQDAAWPDHRVTISTSAGGSVRRFVIDDSCRVVAETDACGGITRTEYDARNRVTARIDAAGGISRYAYSEAGQPLSETSADGATVEFEADPVARVVTVAEEDGAQWSRRFDERGNCTSVTDPSGVVTHYAYSDLGHLASVTDPLGATTTIRCNDAGLPVEITDPLGNRTIQRYDAFGRRTEVVDPLGAITRTEWALDGKPARLTRPDGSSETWDYDGEGNCLRHTDAAGQTTSYEYTHFDVPASRTTPDGVRHSFTYDSALRLVSVTAEDGLVWRYEYDANGRVVAEEDWDGRRVTFRRDLLGRIVERTNALGQSVAYTYDAAGRTATKTVADVVTEYTYSPGGALLRAVAPDCDVAFERDALGRVTAETVNGHVLRFALDAAGQRVERITPGGAHSRYKRDAAGNLTGLTTVGRALTFTHDGRGRQLSRSLGERFTLAQQWGPDGTLVNQTLLNPTGTVQRRDYGYRADGALTEVDDLLRGDVTFTLDTASRITSVQAPNWSESYAYNALGDQAHATWPVRQAGSDSSGDRTSHGTTLTRAGSTRYAYDAVGRLVEKHTSDGVWYYAWDAEDRLTSLTTPTGACWRYHYDPFGRRLSKTLGADEDEIAEMTVFTWDGETLVEESRTDGTTNSTVTLSWEHENGHVLSQAERRVDSLSGAELDSRFFGIVTDQVGTPTELVDENGGIAWRARATLWGVTAWPAESHAYTPLRFPGQYHDLESGLHYNRYRYYDPAVARFLSPDPLGLEPAPNPFTYPYNPHLFVDPLGLSPYGGFRGRMRAWFGGDRVRQEAVDQQMRAARTPTRLGDLEGIELPDIGTDPMKEGIMRSMGDEQLLEAINDPDGIGHVVTLGEDSVSQGNHRINEALSRMNNPRHPGITPDTEILVLGDRWDDAS